MQNFKYNATMRAICAMMRALYIKCTYVNFLAKYVLSVNSKRWHNTPHAGKKNSLFYKDQIAIKICFSLALASLILKSDASIGQSNMFFFFQLSFKWSFSFMILKIVVIISIQLLKTNTVICNCTYSCLATYSVIL